MGQKLYTVSILKMAKNGNKEINNMLVINLGKEIEKQGENIIVVETDGRGVVTSTVAPNACISEKSVETIALETTKWLEEMEKKQINMEQQADGNDLKTTNQLLHQMMERFEKMMTGHTEILSTIKGQQQVCNNQSTIDLAAKDKGKAVIESNGDKDAVYKNPFFSKVVKGSATRNEPMQGLGHKGSASVGVRISEPGQKENQPVSFYTPVTYQADDAAL